jgi:FkbM family methyltransferase
MVKKIERPFVYNWLAWHFYHRYKQRKAAQRATAWRFVNQLHTLPPNSLAIDCGANVGKVSQVLLKHGCEVHAFEPDPYAADLLENRCGRDPRLHLHRSAVGTAAGSLTLYRTTDFAREPQEATIGSSLMKREVHDDSHAVQVEVIDLLAFLRSLDRRVAILKLDIEGSEAAILERLLDEGLHERIDAIYVETHERFSPELSRRIGALRDRVAREGLSHILLDWV